MLVLLRGGASRNVVNAEGMTALEVAEEEGEEAIAALLRGTPFVAP
eukprot:COSAG01_NODE_5685_length_4101_cov_98.783858_4_plen_46_part_00